MSNGSRDGLVNKYQGDYFLDKKVTVQHKVTLMKTKTYKRKKGVLTNQFPKYILWQRGNGFSRGNL